MVTTALTWITAGIRRIYRTFPLEFWLGHSAPQFTTTVCYVKIKNWLRISSPCSNTRVTIEFRRQPGSTSARRRLLMATCTNTSALYLARFLRFRFIHYSRNCGILQSSLKLTCFHESCWIPAGWESMSLFITCHSSRIGMGQDFFYTVMGLGCHLMLAL